MVALTFLGLVDLNATFFIMLASFGVLYLILKHFLFKPVNEMLDKRAKGIKDDITEAEKMRKEAESYKAEYEEKIISAETEGKTIIEKAVSNANLKADTIVKDAKNEASGIKIKAGKDIELEKNKAFNEVKDQISGIAISAASKILESEVDEKKNKELVEKFIDEVGDVEWQD